MRRLVSVARAARVIGIGRSELQAQIRRGELPTFEGQIDLDLLQDLYPTVRLERSVAVERVRHIKETAFGRRVVDTVVVEEEMQAHKARRLQRDLDIERLKVRHLEDLTDGLGKQLNQLQLQATREQALTISCIKGWLLQEMEKL
jgi:CDP-4-dehydro-6-deoxyglucose reductase